MNPDEIALILGKVIRERRKALGYSQEGFSEAVGLHRTYIGAVERGEQNITIKNLAKLSLVLKEPLSGLLAEHLRLHFLLYHSVCNKGTA